jgi:hypothetical protein
VDFSELSLVVINSGCLDPQPFEVLRVREYIEGTWSREEFR